VKKLELVSDSPTSNTLGARTKQTAKGSSKNAKFQSKEPKSNANKREPVAAGKDPIEDDTIVVAHTNSSAADERSPEENGIDVADEKANDANRDERFEINHPATVTEPSDQHIKGSSQHQPLVLSDADESSEDEILVPVDQLGTKKPATSKFVVGKGTGLPTTPAYQTKQLSTPMNTSRKANIIAFDQSGPRNQGPTLSTAKKRPTVYKKVPPKRVPLSKKDPNQKMHTGQDSSKDSSSAVKKIEERKIPAKSRLGNVASTMSDAIAGLLSSKRQPVEDNTKTTSSKRPKLDHDFDSHARLNDATKPTHHDLEASMLDDLLYNFDDFVRTSPSVQQDSPAKPQIALRTASQLAMPPPKTAVMESNQSKSAFDHEANLRTHSSPSRLANHRSNKSVRSHKSDDSALSRRKPENTEQERTNHKLTFTGEQTESSGTKRVRLQETPAEAQMVTTTAQQGHRDSSSARRKSSQTVDIRGSPVPRDMEIVDQSTVLEAYCHRTQQSPDSEEAIEDELPPPPPTFAANTDSANLETLRSLRTITPLLGSGDILSSHKPRPAAPLADSKMVTGLRTRKGDSALLLGRGSADITTPNPFIQETLQKGKSPVGAPSFPLLPDPTRKLDEQLDLIRHRLSKSKTIASTSHPNISHAAVSGALDASRETTIRALTAGHALLRAPSDPNSSASPAKAQQNLTIWRSALRPHHLNLFDELVSLAHRATQSLVDQDTAFAQSLSDYQRRSLTIIEKWEEHQKAFYAQLQNSLHKKRELVTAELKAYVKNFEGCADAARKVRVEWEGQKEARRKVDERVEGVLRRFGGESE
jgi:hypothetical protein